MHSPQGWPNMAAQMAAAKCWMHGPHGDSGDDDDDDDVDDDVDDHVVDDDAGVDDEQ